MNTLANQTPETIEIVEPTSEHEARRLTKELRSAAEAFASLYIEAYTKRIWEVFGYDSWEDYLEVEFSDFRVLPMKQKRDEFITDLAAAGMSTRAIAATADVSKDTANRVIRNAKKNGDLPETLDVVGTDGKTRTYKTPEVDDSIMDMPVDDFGINHFEKKSPKKSPAKATSEKTVEPEPAPQDPEDIYGLKLVDTLADELGEAIRASIEANNREKFDAEYAGAHRVEALARVLLANAGLLERLNLQRDLFDNHKEIRQILESAVITIDTLVGGLDDEDDN